MIRAHPLSVCECVFYSALLLGDSSNILCFAPFSSSPPLSLCMLLRRNAILITHCQTFSTFQISFLLSFLYFRDHFFVILVLVLVFKLVPHTYSNVHKTNEMGAVINEMKWNICRAVVVVVVYFVNLDFSIEKVFHLYGKCFKSFFANFQPGTA